jgi:predicted secreted protein with PEFG-CTERM motif
MTSEPLRNSDYTFVIIQNGKEIHRTSGTAQIGGDFEKFTFNEDQTGPMIIKFENIRNTGQETEFGIVVAPEFGTIVLLILVTSIMGVIFVTRRNSFRFSI